MDAQSPRCNNTKEGGAGFAVIIVPVLLSLSTVVVVFFILWSLYCRRPGRESLVKIVYNAGHGSMSIDAVSGTRLRVQGPLDTWQMPADCTLEALESMQMGHYGNIYKSQLRRGCVTTAVLVKTLQGSNSQATAEEFAAWAQFHAVVCRHENLVRMLFCQTQKLPMYLVLEASSPGNLLHFLWTLRQNDVEKPSQLEHFSERSVYLVAKQVSAGLDYLFSEHGLYHGDVAARNMLIGSGLSVKVSGLGMAFEARQMGKVAKPWVSKVPVKWQAPERIMQLPLTDRSDVWSFGILLYELITLGSPPYPDMEPMEVFPQLQKSHRMRRPESCGRPLYDLMKYCWMWNFKDRPYFSSIIKLLDSYVYLADTKILCAEDKMDITEYKKAAGFLSSF
ncbi:tyrosine-protein kinase STYK1 [Paramormyrops kingsleyae]|uniref:tyrosine-protein kinase STYK1 n=1 Tax=Paramormyrops kingsleyae TaxID=1676925 RepID=UPI003B971C5A